MQTGKQIKKIERVYKSPAGDGFALQTLIHVRPSRCNIRVCSLAFKHEMKK